MNFLFLMDPLETVKMAKDTSFILMLGAHQKGHNIFYLPDGGISQEQGKTIFHVEKIIPQTDPKQPFLREGYQDLNESSVDAIFIRTDPPFDYKYLMHTWMLDRVSPHIVIINSPQGIRTVNEKVWATQFTSIIPPTFVGRNKDAILSFINSHQQTIAKPTDGFGGQSVFRINKGDPNINVILETLSQNFSRDIILQKYISDSTDGDKRIILLDGEPLGAVLRKHADDDHRNNFFSGGKAVKSNITDRDKTIIKEIKPYLKDLGLYFVGIDIIGDYLIEINVTSPTCLQEINRFDNKEHHLKVIDFVENLVESHKQESL